MRSPLLLAMFVVVGCASQENAVTDDDNELNEGVGSIERPLDPPMAAPTDPAIGAKTADVLTKAKGTATGKTKKGNNGCSTTTYEDGATKKAIAQREVCAD